MPWLWDLDFLEYLGSFYMLEWRICEFYAEMTATEAIYDLVSSTSVFNTQGRIGLINALLWISFFEVGAADVRRTCPIGTCRMRCPARFLSPSFAVLSLLFSFSSFVYSLTSSFCNSLQFDYSDQAPDCDISAGLRCILTGA